MTPEQHLARRWEEVYGVRKEIATLRTRANDAEALAAAQEHARDSMHKEGLREFAIKAFVAWKDAEDVHQRMLRYIEYFKNMDIFNIDMYFRVLDLCGREGYYRWRQKMGYHIGTECSDWLQNTDMLICNAAPYDILKEFVNWMTTEVLICKLRAEQARERSDAAAAAYEMCVAEGIKRERDRAASLRSDIERLENYLASLQDTIRVLEA
jgi:hypothetical protein